MYMTIAFIIYGELGLEEMTTQFVIEQLVTLE
jgi:hypothetical protein